MDRLSAMEAFVRVLESGSFSKAALQLQIGQPAISKTIGSLESRLGVRLVLRSTQGLTATEAGKKFYEHARRAIWEAENADVAARGAGTTLIGRLRVSSSVTFAKQHIIPNLPSFLAQNPALEVDVVMIDRDIDLVKENIDVAMVWGSPQNPTTITRKIGECGRLVAGTPAYFAQVGEPNSPDELVAHQVFMQRPSIHGNTCTFRRGSMEKSIVVGSRLRLNAGEGLREAVLAGLGVAITSAWLFSPELQRGDVRRVLSSWSLSPQTYWAVFPTGNLINTKARAFTAFVEAQLHKRLDSNQCEEVA